MAYTSISSTRTAKGKPISQALMDDIRSDITFLYDLITGALPALGIFSNAGSIVDLSLAGDSNWHDISGTAVELFVPANAATLKIRVSSEMGSGATGAKIKCQINGGTLDESDEANTTTSQNEDTLTITVSAANRGMICPFKFRGYHTTGSAKTCTIYWYYVRTATYV